MPQNEKRDEDAAAQLDKEVVPPSEANKPVFSASSLVFTPVRMAEDISKAISELFSSQSLVLSAVPSPVSDDIAVGKIWEKIVGISSSLFPDLPDTA